MKRKKVINKFHYTEAFLLCENGKTAIETIADLEYSANCENDKSAIRKLRRIEKALCPHNRGKACHCSGFNKNG